MLCALIMAGGKGTRFWPLSTEEKPKQFLNLVGENTMIQMTIDRISKIIPIERIFICTGEKYVDLVKEQTPQILNENIIIEPEGRNTAPCIALSAMYINRKFKDANMVVLPSDHLIQDEEKFNKILLDASNFVNNNKEAILTLGMKPSRPETGYGYIKWESKFLDSENCSIYKVDSFKEKPNLETAQEYISNGSYLWNGGMFIWNINNIIAQIKKYCFSTYEALKDIYKCNEEDIQEFINNNYTKTDSISIDYAVLEKSNSIYVIPSEIGWDDIGTWKSVERYKDKDSYNNIIDGDIKLFKSRSNIAINKSKKMIMIGIDNIMTLETDDSIYIVHKDYIDNLKDYKNKL